MYDPLINEPHPDVAEISISTDDVDIVATYGREARVIFVVDEGTTGVLKVGTRDCPQGRTFTELEAGAAVEPSPAWVKKIYGTTDGVTTVAKVRLGF